ncbi:hypothetical protein EJ04DRAFT_157562 [Polyplosphaeria fusca]|uniref:Secreted protein n=1 Tax=Polyplosphaeria fusca TaxID=682080 RepID=A0A9P4QZ56_9PLEO|nr:hypothetical protein EJ04DRAFT_157562 [Polyplosphaeria fusca]
MWSSHSKGRSLLYAFLGAGWGAVHSVKPSPKHSNSTAAKAGAPCTSWGSSACCLIRDCESVGGGGGGGGGCCKACFQID